MTRRVKVAISIPQQVLEHANRESAARGISRSQLFADAVTALVRAERERNEVERYVSGYVQQPETDEDAFADEVLLAELLEEEEWP